MRRLRIPSAALLGGAALVLAAPAAVAAGSAGPTATVSPATASPGQTITLTLRGCDDPSQGGRAEGELVGNGTTGRTPMEATDLKPGADGALVGTAAVSPGLKSGSVATISFACGSNPNAVVTAPLTIAAGPTSRLVTPSARTAPATSQAPPTGVDAGLGGSITHGNAAEVALGALSVTAGVGIALALRRRNAKSRR
ncbi:hypothetical protein [Streptomyces sp. SDr-06]|uniref:hypothetical protein n=1 Tax=Streptomyces sp. SDr-06 TaxID=2267702 RepID=UPI000DE9282D|nr:hypothetical protein [Streptomyces sp. SDr-06]RCH70207.1 hypothetical protein DT019_01520 [Streptomyces sp. SDr-06]